MQTIPATPLPALYNSFVIFILVFFKQIELLKNFVIVRAVIKIFTKLFPVEFRFFEKKPEVNLTVF